SSGRTGAAGRAGSRSLFRIARGIRALLHRRPPQGRARRRSHRRPRPSASRSPLTATPSPSRLSLPKAIGWSVAFVVLTLLLASLLGVGAATTITGSVPSGLTWLQQVTAGPMLLQAGLTIGCSLFFTWLIGMRVLRLTPADLRWTIPRGGAGFGYGVLAGCLVAGIA